MELIKEVDSDRGIPQYYDEDKDEFKQLNKENLKAMIREVLEEDTKTMPHLNGVD